MIRAHADRAGFDCRGPAPASHANLIGQASIIDGDTLEIHGTRIRLWGIDAPEHDQFCRGDDSLPYHCGAKAANELDAFIARRPVSCEPVGRDVYGRTVARCSVASVDLSEWLVRGRACARLAEVFQGRRTGQRSTKRKALSGECGREAGLRPGCIGLASRMAASRALVRTMRMRTLESLVPGTAEIAISRRRITLHA